MSNNANWGQYLFQSSPIKPVEGFLRPEQKNSIDDVGTSPEKLFFNKSPIAVRQALPMTPINFVQSPWSRAQQQQQNLFDDFHLPCMYSNQEVSVPQQVNLPRRIDFGEDDEENYDIDGDPRMSDMRDIYRPQDFSARRKTVRDDDFVLTTAKKSVDHVGLGQKMTRPREKGLRKLSSRAFQIVLQMKSATYKEVATKLVDQLYQQSQLDSDVSLKFTQGKDEQNIKRRVYDALNVLIALGILRKQGRKIVGQKRTKKNGVSAIEEYQLMQQRCQAEQRNFVSKKQKLEELKGKYNVIKNLISRNKKIDVSSESSIIRFPFIGTVVSDLKDSNMDFNGQRFSLKSNCKVKPFGDVDSLNFLPANFKAEEKHKEQK